MLVAVLNCCSQEELEHDEKMAEAESPSVSPEAAAIAERKRVIRNKILAVGRVARVFSVLRSARPFPHIAPYRVADWIVVFVGYREESERVSELKHVSGSSKLPYGTLVLGAQGIMDAINSFEEA